MKEHPPRTAMEVFKSLPEGTRVQLIENIIVMEPAPVYAHQDLLGSINNLIYNFVKQHGLGEVLFAPFDVYLDDENAFQPDLLFVARERLHLIKENGLYGAPDLVVELLSPSTAKYDLVEKKRVYERSGVKEYWIVDPLTHAVQGYWLKNGVFKAFLPTEGLIRSELLDTEFEF